MVQRLPVIYIIIFRMHDYKVAHLEMMTLDHEALFLTPHIVYEHVELSYLAIHLQTNR